MPLQTLAEKARQSLGLGSPPFQPISLTRYSQALGEAGRYAAWLAAVRRELETAESAVAGFLVSSLATLPDCSLPSLYSERVDNHELTTIPAPPPPPQFAHLFTLPAAAAGAALMRGTQPDAIAAPLPAASAVVAKGPRGDANGSSYDHMHSGRSAASTGSNGVGFEGVLSSGQYAELSEAMQRLPGQFRAAAQAQFLGPIEVWLQAYREAQVRLSSLNKLRLKVDAARRKLDRKGRAALASITNGNSTAINAITTTATPAPAQAATPPGSSSSSVVQGAAGGGVGPSAQSASWAAAAVGVAEGGAAAGGLVETQQVLQHDLQPVLSEFAAAEQSLSVLLTWLVEQAACLRAALAALLLQLATALEHWRLPQGLLQPLPAAAGGVKGAAVLLSAPAGPLGEGQSRPEDEQHHTYSYTPHPAAAAAAARAQQYLASTSAGPLGEGREAASDENEDEDDFIHEPYPAAAAAAVAAAADDDDDGSRMSGHWPASSTEAAGRAFRVRPSFEEELQRELSSEGRQLAAESTSRQLSMQQHGSTAAIGAIIGSDAGDETASAGPGSSGSAAAAAGNRRSGSHANAATQQRQIPGTSVQWVPGVGVVPADREDAAAAASLGVPVRSRRNSALSSGGSSTGNIASLNHAAAEPAASAAEHSKRGATSAGIGGAAEFGSASAHPRSPQAGLVQGLWDSALMSYLQRDTALLEGLTGEDEACAACEGEQHAKQHQPPGFSPLDQERQALLTRAAELQAERDTCQAAAAEAAALRDEAAARAARVKALLAGELPDRKRQLQQEREVLSSQLSELSSKHASLLQQLAECEGQVAELQQQTAGLQDQQGQVAHLRDEAAATLSQLLPAAAQLAAAREALAARLQGAEQQVAQHQATLRQLEEQVSTAAAALASAESAAAAAGQCLQAAEREAQEGIKRMAETHSQEAAAIISLANVTRVQLPTAAGSAATVAGLAARHEQQVRRLQGQLQQARQEQQQELQQEEHLKDMSAAAASRLSELESTAEQLSCQAAALQAQAAGAGGLQAAEQARATAAAAEARGLQAAANTLAGTVPAGGLRQQQMTSAGAAPAGAAMPGDEAAANKQWRSVPSLERQQHEQETAAAAAAAAAAGEEPPTAEDASEEFASAAGSDELAVAGSSEGAVASAAAAPAGSAAAAEAAHEAVIIEVQPSMPSELPTAAAAAAMPPAAVTTAPLATTPDNTAAPVPHLATSVATADTIRSSKPRSVGADEVVVENDDVAVEDDDVPPPPSHDAELAAAAELAHQARLQQDPSLAAAADAAKAQQAAEVAAEQGVYEAAARRIVGLPAYCSGAPSDTMAAAAVPETGAMTPAVLTQAIAAPPAAAAKAKQREMMVMPLSGVAEEVPWMEPAAAVAAVAATTAAEQQQMHAAAPTTPAVTTAAEPESALHAAPAAATAADDALAEHPEDEGTAIAPQAAAAAAPAPHAVRRSETVLATAGSTYTPEQSTTTADEPGVVQLDVQPKPRKRVTLMLAGPLGGAEDAGAVPVQGVLVGGPSAADQQREHTLYKTHRQWANHRRNVEATAAAAPAYPSWKAGQGTGSSKWRQMRTWEDQFGYGAAGWSPLAAAGVSDAEWPWHAAGGHMGSAGLPAQQSAEGSMRSVDMAAEGVETGRHHGVVPHGHGQLLQQGTREVQQGRATHSRQQFAAAAAPAGPDDPVAPLGAGAYGGDAVDAASKVLRWQQSSAPAEEQGPLAGGDMDSRTLNSASPGVPESFIGAPADLSSHKPHTTAPYHQQQQQQQLAPARVVAGPAPAHHTADAAAVPATYARQAGSGYSAGADAAAQSLLREWQALPGPLEMGGELPRRR